MIEGNQALRRPRDLAAAVAAFLLPIAFSPSVFAAYWSPKASLLVVVGVVSCGFLLERAWRGDLAARFAVAFLAWSAIAALASRRPVLAFTGIYNAGTGWLFLAGVLGVWALGRTVSEEGRRRALVAFLAALAIGAAVAVMQTLIDLSSYQLGRPLGRADSFFGNPVHLGAAMAGGLGIVSWLWINERAQWALGLLVAFSCALQLSGSRFALAAGLLVSLLPARPRTAIRVVIAVAALAIGLGLGEVIARGADASSGSTRAVAGASSGLTPRVEMWKAAVTAIAERPIVGWGPGRFREATGPERSLRFAHAEGPDRVFTDAHNVVVELATTTGVVGLLLVAGWAVLSLRGVRGPYALGAAGILLLTLMQPLAVSTTPLGLLLLGCAAPRVQALPRSRLVTVAAGALALPALAMGAVLLAGDYFRVNAFLDFTRDDARRSRELLPFWAESYELSGRIELYESIVAAPDDPELLARAIDFQVLAVDREPDDADMWNKLGALHLRAEEFSDAARSFESALATNPQSLTAWIGLGQSAMARGRFDAAANAFTEAAKRAVDEESQRFVEQRLRAAQRGGGVVP